MKLPIEETLPLALRYDADEGKLYWRDEWWPKSRTTNTVGAMDGTKRSPTGYVRFEHRGRRFMVHRVIWFMHHGEWPDGEIDHIDGNGLNNHISNLRVVDHKANMYNRPMYRCNKTGYKGVSKNARENLYRAQISKDRVPYKIGSFACPIDAARAYDRKAIELHGEYARTNFPIEDYLSG